MENFISSSELANDLETFLNNLFKREERIFQLLQIDLKNVIDKKTLDYCLKTFPKDLRAEENKRKLDEDRIVEKYTGYHSTKNEDLVLGLKFSEIVRAIANTLKAKHRKYSDQAVLSSTKVFYNSLTVWVANLTEQPVLNVKKLLIQISELSHERLMSSLKSYLRNNATEVLSPVLTKSQNPFNNPSLLVTKKQSAPDPKWKNPIVDNYSAFNKRRDFPIHPLRTNNCWMMATQLGPKSPENRVSSNSHMYKTNKQFHLTKGISKSAFKLKDPKKEMSNIEKDSFVPLPMITIPEEKIFYKHGFSAANITKIEAVESDSKLGMKNSNYLKSDLNKVIRDSKSGFLLEPSQDLLTTTNESTNLTKLYLNNNNSLMSNNAQLLDGSYERPYYNFVGRQENTLESTMQMERMLSGSHTNHKEAFHNKKQLEASTKEQRSGSVSSDHGMLIRSYDINKPDSGYDSNVLGLLFSTKNKQELQQAEYLLPKHEINVLNNSNIRSLIDSKPDAFSLLNQHSYFMDSPSYSSQKILLFK